MTPSQLMKHYKNNKSAAARAIGCTRGAIGFWIEANKIPILQQRWIETVTEGKLKAKEEAGE